MNIVSRMTDVVQSGKCRLLKSESVETIKDKLFVGGNQKDFDTRVDEEVFFLCCESGKTSFKVFGVALCGEIQYLKGDVGKNVMFIDPKGLYARPIICKCLLKNDVKFDNEFARHRFLRRTIMPNPKNHLFD